MTEEEVFFDTDCISAFLWTGNESIVNRLYGGRIVFPQMVYEELSRAGNLLVGRIDAMVAADKADVRDIVVGSQAFLLYDLMTSRGSRVIGKGEASALSMAITEKGVVASNNLRDVMPYVRQYGVKHITTAGIMVEAYESGIIDLKQGDAIWRHMLDEGRMLGAATFSEHYNKMPRNPL